MEIRNHEHYIDETPYKAIKNLPKSGEIWIYTHSKKGTTVQVLVIKNHGRFSTVMPLFDGERDGNIPILSNVIMYAHPGKLQHTYNDMMTYRVRKLPAEDFKNVLHTLGTALGIIGSEKDG